jgi:hypothetical protein
MVADGVQYLWRGEVSLDRDALLQELAARYPHGVVGRDRRRPAA